MARTTRNNPSQDSQDTTVRIGRANRVTQGFRPSGDLTPSAADIPHAKAFEVALKAAWSNRRGEGLTAADVARILMRVSIIPGDPADQRDVKAKGLDLRNHLRSMDLRPGAPHAMTVGDARNVVRSYLGFKARAGKVAGGKGKGDTAASSRVARQDAAKDAKARGVSKGEAIEASQEDDA